MISDTEFQGMNALITGASRGIGAETAFAFGSRGAFTLIHYNSSQAGAADVLQRIQAEGGNGVLLQSDLSSLEGIHHMIKLVRQMGRSIDILVNNAGSLIKRTPFLDFTEDLWNQVFTLNLTSAFLITQALLPGMLERKRGCIVNISYEY